MSNRLAAVATVALLTAASTQARAQAGGSTDDRARLHFQSGAAYYDAGEYESAVREFQSAYDLSQRPQLFYNLYLCEQAIGNLGAAAAHLERYLAEVEEIENRDTLQSRLVHLRERVARQAAGEEDPGPTAEEAAEQQQRAAPSDEEERAVADPTPPPPPPDRGPNVGAIAGFSVAALGVIGAVIFGPLTIAEDSSLAGGCGAARACTDADTSTLSTYALLTDVSLGVALAGALAGTLFLVLDMSSGGDGERASLRVSPLAGPGTAGLTVRGAL
jgi:tetratricopeptide (TPR) repeat protein